MRIYIGLDDTDGKESAMGTGRLARTLAGELLHYLEGNATLWGVLRHQLPRLENIPYTSNNSSACIVLNLDSDTTPLVDLLDFSATFITQKSDPEGDPGLCILMGNEVSEGLMAYSMRTTSQRMSQKDAMVMVPGGRLLGLGGTNDGIIGAAAAVGLTHHGWCGRFIEFGDMRKAPTPHFVGEVQELGIQVVSVDRDPAMPLAEDPLVDAIWIRPSLWGGGPVLQVNRCEGGWRTAHGKRKKRHGEGPHTNKPGHRKQGKPQLM